MLVEEVETEKGPVVELVVEHEDLGKVIGRSGRVAQALRTLVRASAEGRISIDIISFEDEVVEGTAEAGADIGRSAGSDDADDVEAAAEDAATVTADAADEAADAAVRPSKRSPSKRSRKTEK